MSELSTRTKSRGLSPRMCVKCWEYKTHVKRELKIKISMDGKGRCLGNAKMERFWWSLKYENIYLNDYSSLAQMRRGVQSYVNFYNARRIHSALDWSTPDEIFNQSCKMAI
ncbi:MAG: transposase [Lentisphaerae bacterium]|nr:transposase [Lentisphaerota bacterium]